MVCAESFETIAATAMITSAKGVHVQSNMLLDGMRERCQNDDVVGCKTRYHSNTTVYCCKYTEMDIFLIPPSAKHTHTHGCMHTHTHTHAQKLNLVTMTTPTRNSDLGVLTVTSIVLISTITGTITTDTTILTGWSAGNCGTVRVELVSLPAHFRRRHFSRLRKVVWYF